MIHNDHTKIVIVTAPELKDNGSPTLTYVDTKGWQKVRFIFVVGVTDIATTAAPTITESALSDSAYVAITSPVTAALSAVIAADDDGKAYAIDIDMTAGARKRYLQPTFVAGDGSNGTNVAIIAILSRSTSGSVNELVVNSAFEELISA